MTEQLIVLLFAVMGLIVVMATGLPIAFSLGAVSVAVLIYLDGWTSLAAVPQVIFEGSFSFLIVAIPLFILMGNIIRYGGYGEDIFDVCSKWLSWLPGGLATASVASCAIFGAISGSAVAGTATIGTVAIPQMQRKGYRYDLCFGSVAAAGGLAALIPPSIVMIMYADLSGTSVSKLFMAGVVPGLVVVVVFSLYHLIVAMLNPEAAPREMGVPWSLRLKSLSKVIAPIILIIMVLGTIYTGIATPTEAAAVGALVAFILTLVRLRGVKGREARLALKDSNMTAAYILFILVNAQVFSYVITKTDIVQATTAWIVSLGVSRWVIFGLLWSLMLILGMVLDGSSLIVLTTPLAFPVMMALGFDPVWYGVILVLNVEIGAITPPVGLHFYVVAGLVPKIPLNTVIKGCYPYVGLFHVVTLLIVLMPSLSLWLPSAIS